jgi:ATP-dependent RNA helicase RhlB
MIKKLLKKLFGAKVPETGARKGPAHPVAAKPAAEHQERRRHGGKAEEQPAGHKRRERPAASGGEAAAPGAEQGPAKPARRRRGGRGRGKGGTTGPAPATDRTAATPTQAERAPRQRETPPPRDAAGAGADPKSDTPTDAGTDAGAPKRARRRRRRGGSRPKEGSTPAPGEEGTAPEAEEAADVSELETGAPADAEPPPPAAEEPVDQQRQSSGRERRPRETGPREHIPLPDLPPIPPWTPPDDPTRFSAYDLPPEVQAGINDAGYTECTPVQSKVLPLSLQGRDVAAQSQTGTGKTAAFLITIFSRLLQRGPVDGPKPRALIIAPTRELAVQIESEARNMGAHTGLSAVAIFGGVDYEKQRQALRLGADLVVGTPGRLIDFLKQGAWHTEGVEMLVIDEADRMFDMGFVQDLRYILGRLPHRDRRQTMLFSATLNYSVTEVTYEYMNLPAEIRATPERMTAALAEEVLHHVSREEKPGLLLGIMEREKPERTMIFTNTKAEAEKVAKLLEHHGVRARGITGNLEQARRLKLMEEFKNGELPVMVATDVASRGLHIDAVSLVVNWDLPQDPEDYVHRIGRTARAGAAGKAISLADESGALNLEAIESLIGYKIPVIWHDQEHLAEVRPGWREAAARERREREKELEARGIRPSRGPRSGPAPGRQGGGGRSRPGGSRRR